MTISYPFFHWVFISNSFLPGANFYAAKLENLHQKASYLSLVSEPRSPDDPVKGLMLACRICFLELELELEKQTTFFAFRSIRVGIIIYPE